MPLLRAPRFSDETQRVSHHLPYPGGGALSSIDLKAHRPGCRPDHATNGRAAATTSPWHTCTNGIATRCQSPGPATTKASPGLGRPQPQHRWTTNPKASWREPLGQRRPRLEIGQSWVRAVAAPMGDASRLCATGSSASMHHSPQECGVWSELHENTMRHAGQRCPRCCYSFFIPHPATAAAVASARQCRLKKEGQSKGSGQGQKKRRALRARCTRPAKRAGSVVRGRCPL